MAFYCPGCEPDRRPSYGWSPANCPAHAPEPKPSAMARRNAEVAAMSLEERSRAFVKAMASDDLDEANVIASAPIPPTWPEAERAKWGSRRQIVRAVSGG